MTRIDLNSYLSDSSKLPRTSTLFRQNGLRTLLLHLNQGDQIPEHRTPGAITVQCLKGKGSFAIGDEQTPLNPASIISVAPATPHSVTAEEDTVLLVTVWEQLRTEPVYVPSSIELFSF